MQLEVSEKKKKEQSLRGMFKIDEFHVYVSSFGNGNRYLSKSECKQANLYYIMLYFVLN